jgi:hypothetical protein
MFTTQLLNAGIQVHGKKLLSAVVTVLLHHRFAFMSRRTAKIGQKWPAIAKLRNNTAQEAIQGSGSPSFSTPIAHD